MASTTFTNNVTLTDAAWFNDVNTVAYAIFGDGSSYTGNITLNTNKFTVAYASGNTSIAGTLALSGALTYGGVTLSGVTGTGSMVLHTSPTLISPVLGTPASGNLVNCTGYVGTASLVTTGTITSGTWSASFGAVSGANLTNLTAANISAGTAGINISGNAATATNVAVGGITGLGTGVATALAVNVGSAGAPVVNGGALGTPSSGVATNLTGTASGLSIGGNAATATTATTANAVASGGLTASALASSAVEIGAMTNGTIVNSRTGNAETIAIKTLAGADPSAADPVIVLFRNATVGTGDYSVIKITAATSLTISSGSTMGFTNAVAGRLWIIGFNDAGTFRLGAINCVATAANPGTGRDVTGITSLGSWGIASSTAEGGAGGADSAQVFYTGTAVTSKAYAVLGYCSWESGLATAGTWVTAPTRIQLFDPSVSLPGTPVQVAFNYTGATASGTTIIPADDTIPQNTEGDQYMTQAITPSSACNGLLIEAAVMLQNGNGGLNTAVLFQDSNANGFAALTQPGAAAAAITVGRALLAQTTSSTTFKARAGNNGGTAVQFNGVSGSGRIYGGIYSSFMRVTEVMG